MVITKGGVSNIARKDISGLVLMITHGYWQRL
jgi:hypothetical protein